LVFKSVFYLAIGLFMLPYSSLFRSVALSFSSAVVLCSSAFAQSNAAGAVALPTETLSNGVKVQHVVRGTGAQPKAADAVKVHYRGTLADGKEFDSSYKRNTPITFPLHQVIPCWTEGLQKMKVGGKAILTCPAPSAYGERGVPGAIPPNATLTFEVELLGIGS
jgi:FKBP-type peptidyl-prolyl cis-trans isomerase FkpA